jgi:hypothetical protein
MNNQLAMLAMLAMPYTPAKKMAVTSQCGDICHFSGKRLDHRKYRKHRKYTSPPNETDTYAINTYIYIR